MLALLHSLFFLHLGEILIKCMLVLVILCSSLSYFSSHCLSILHCWLFLQIVFQFAKHVFNFVPSAINLSIAFSNLNYYIFQVFFFQIYLCSFQNRRCDSFSYYKHVTNIDLTSLLHKSIIWRSSRSNTAVSLECPDLTHGNSVQPGSRASLRTEFVFAPAKHPRVLPTWNFFMLITHLEVFRTTKEVEILTTH